MLQSGIALFLMAAQEESPEMTFYDAAYGKSYTFSVIGGKRLSGKHVLTPADESRRKMARIDGQIFWGHQWSKFSDEADDSRYRLLASIVITVGRNKIEFPSKALFGLFGVDMNSDSPPRWIDNAGNIYFKISGGDGGDAYCAIFCVSQKKRTIERTIYWTEALATLGERKVFSFNLKPVVP